MSQQIMVTAYAMADLIQVQTTNQKNGTSLWSNKKHILD